jgi:hypothetical protein
MAQVEPSSSSSQQADGNTGLAKSKTGGAPSLDKIPHDHDVYNVCLYVMVQYSILGAMADINRLLNNPEATTTMGKSASFPLGRGSPQGIVRLYLPVSAFPTGSTHLGMPIRVDGICRGDVRKSMHFGFELDKQHSTLTQVSYCNPPSDLLPILTGTASNT